MQHRVFVYGSLMQGFGNHGLLQESTFLGRASIEGARLYSLGAFPAVILSDRDGARVYGEVYEVSDATLSRLDRLEGHPHFYRREENRARIENLDGPFAVAFYHYQQGVKEENFIPSGDWHHATANQARALRA